MRRRRRVAARSPDPDKACTTLEYASKVRKVGSVCKRNFAVSTVTEGEQATGGAVAKREEEGPNGGEAAAVQRARREFLHDAQIAKDKWPSLLGSDSLCKAVINSKAMS
jgi:hypothetical protein